ncbi:site-specific integrase [Corynebacterium glyciniphilum]|uniref:tyrosine-type recombinase/integrase n=1 Tax=Corynebacterium glyciniphilum TaxID=1404244 RepID=UPI0026535F86|nr:site-specific integrase [Corynebacterium glyciniphilum]MDN6706757.1 tyrosine-type recombinase/integrase [Corynebacterium glyciniphilum]
MPRRQLPPQIKKVAVKSGTRWEVTVDTGPDSTRRAQTRRRFKTEKAARDFLSETLTAVNRGEYAQRSTITVTEFIDQFLAGKRKLAESSAARLRDDLHPLVHLYGDVKLQHLTSANVVTMMDKLTAGGTLTAKERVRRPWGPSSVNKALQSVNAALDYAKKTGIVVKNVAEHIEPLPVQKKEMQTLTTEQVQAVFAAVQDDRNRHVVHLALMGLRRGEIAGLRWSDVDLDSGTLMIRQARGMVNGKVIEKEPKTVRSARTLPLTPSLRDQLKSAKVRQAKERLALGPDAGAGEYVASNEAGEPYRPEHLYRVWQAACKAAGVPEVRLHDARHTAATTMHLEGVPLAVVSQWIGHSSAAFTMATYAHSQDDRLLDAARTLDYSARDTGTDL